VPQFTRAQRLQLATLPILASLFIRLLGSTLRYRDVQAAREDGSPVPVGITVPGPVVFAFWHRCLLVAAHRFRNQGIAILISPSFDGELIARTVARLGFMPVRGSSSRGGAAGLRAMAEAYTRGHRVAITADGPRGPRMIAKPGTAQLAHLVGAPWIGSFYALPASLWELRSWDRFMIPKPFSTVTFTWPEHTAVLATDDPAATTAAVQHALDTAVCLALKPSTK
jgi:lysophospholipid acyltransferase (LPLAT)-like uncharacterized protein